MKIFVNRRQTKCNFCLQWFTVTSELKCALNICQSCIQKAKNTNCFRFPSFDGSLYQVFLARKNFSIIKEDQSLMQMQKQKQIKDQENKKIIQTIFDQIDFYQDQQIKSIIEKWNLISKKVQNAQIIHENAIQKIKRFFEENKENTQSNKNIILGKLSSEFYEVKTPRSQQPLKDLNLSLQINQNNQQKEDITKIKISQFKLPEELTISSKKKLMNNRLNFKYSNQKQNSSSSSSISISFAKKVINLSSNGGSQTDRSNISSSNKSTLNRIDSTRKIQLSLQAQKQQFSNKINTLKTNIHQHLLQNQNLDSNTQRTMKDSICQALLNTNNFNKCIQLVSYNLQNIDIQCFLKQLNWQNIQVIKLVKVGLKDDQGKKLLEFIKQKNIQTLVVTNNYLTQDFVKYLIEIDIPGLKNVYLSKNQIFSLKNKVQIKQLKQRYKVYL